MSIRYRTAIAVFAAILAAGPARAAPLLQGLAFPLKFEACQDVLTITVWNGGTDILDWWITFDQSWLSALPPTGSNPPGRENQTVISIYVDRTGLANGTYTGHYTIDSNGGKFVREVTMYVQDAAFPHAGPTEVALSLQVPSASFWIDNKGEEMLEWSVSATEPWIEILPPVSGSLPCPERADLTANLVPAGLPSQDEPQVGQIVFDTNAGQRTLPVRYTPQGAGVIGLYADPTGSNCNIIYGPSFVQVFVVHTHTSGATASQFAAPKPACWTNAIWFSDVGLWPISIGNSQAGVSIGYGACHTSAIHLLTINYFATTPPTQSCCPYPVIAHPLEPSGEIVVVDCDDNLLAAKGAAAIIYPDASCLCESVVRVEETTWGRLKAMYGTD
jgi:hypothetical protein